MYEFELGQTIYYIFSNKLHTAPVLSRMQVENLHPDWNNTSAQRDTFQAFGPARTAYATCHGVIPAEEAFGSPEDLAAHIIGAYYNNE
jgi:hypothetical protein